MSFKKKPAFRYYLNLKKFLILIRRLKKLVGTSIGKRQRFVIGVIFLTISLIFNEFQFNSTGMITAFILALLADGFLLWGLYKDVKEKLMPEILILPFFYSLSFGLFGFLTPNFIYKITLAVVFALGLYSLYLSQNILVVSSTRAIALISGARIVSFVLTLVSFFLLTNVLITLRLNIIPIVILLSVYTYLLLYHSLWTYALQKINHPLYIWVAALTLCILELASILWFWPSKPAIIALFLTAFFYIVAGLSHIWFEKRFFKGILWEYAWVGFIAIIVLIVFSG